MSLLRSCGRGGLQSTEVVLATDGQGRFRDICENRRQTEVEAWVELPRQGVRQYVFDFRDMLCNVGGIFRCRHIESEFPRDDTRPLSSRLQVEREDKGRSRS